MDRMWDCCPWESCYQYEMGLNAELFKSINIYQTLLAANNPKDDRVTGPAIWADPPVQSNLDDARRQLSKHCIIFTET